MPTRRGEPEPPPGTDVLRVRYSGDIFIRQRRGGASRMFTELLREFTSRPELGVRPVVGPWLHRNEHLDTLPLPGVRVVPAGSVGDRWTVLRPLNAALDRRPVGSDLLHPTYYDRRHLDRSRRRPLVTTVLDMIPELFPDQSRSGTHESKNELILSSDLVVCISESVRNDVLTVLGDPGVPMVCCPLGVRIDDVAAPTIDERPSDPPIVLYIGNRAGYKHFDVLLRALGLPQTPRLRLVCVGGGPWTTVEREAIGALHQNVRVTRIDADDDELGDWYRRARLLVSTSAGEGFGLPVLEAMAAGCPVVATDIPVYREVAGTAGLLVPVGDPAALHAAVALLLGDDDTARRAANSGSEVASRSTWGRSAERLADAYRSIH